MMKLCSDCRHFVPFTHTDDDGHCQHPQSVWIHPVSGVKRSPLAFSQRHSITGCGMNAQFWEFNPGSPGEPVLDDDGQPF
jgi:hypothetical protein